MSSEKNPHWHTLRNPNAIYSVSSNGEHIVVPVTETPTKLLGFAVVRITDLTPAFATQREAQEWADQQSQNNS